MSFKWCVMLSPMIAGKGRGAILADARWEKGTNIRFTFLDGEQSLRDRVEACAQEWITRTGIDLKFSQVKDASAAQIRISFREEGSWSLLGRYAADNKQVHRPTMNFGWLTSRSSDDEVREVVLHEFGHALGFIHEHQNPDGGMQWNRDAVIKSLSGPPNDWDLPTIEHNVLAPYDPRAVIGTPFDPDSIMLYPFPSDWTLDGRSTTNNSKLSDQDIRLAKRVYG